jgi:archaellum component FlaC
MKTQDTAVNPIVRRTQRIEERIERVNACLERDKGNKDKVASLNEEMEALEAELKFMSFKAKSA